MSELCLAIHPCVLHCWCNRPVGHTGEHRQNPGPQDTYPLVAIVWDQPVVADGPYNGFKAGLEEM